MDEPQSKLKPQRSIRLVPTRAAPTTSGSNASSTNNGDASSAKAASDTGDIEVTSPFAIPPPQLRAFHGMIRFQAAVESVGALSKAVKAFKRNVGKGAGAGAAGGSDDSAASSSTFSAAAAAAAAAKSKEADATKAAGRGNPETVTVDAALFKTLEASLQDLQQDYKDICAERDKWAIEKTGLEAQIISGKTDVVVKTMAVRSELQATKAKLKQQEQQAAEQQAKIKELEQRVGSLSLSSGRVSEFATPADVQSARSEMLGKINTTADELAELRAAAAQREEALEAKLRQGAEKEAELSARIGAQQQENESLLNLMHELLATKERAQAEQERLREDLNREIALLKESVGLCSKCKRSLDGESPPPEIDTELQEKQTKEIALLKSQLADAKAELKTRIDRFNEEKKSLEDTISALLEDQSTAMTEQSNMSERMRQLEEQELKAIELNIQQEDEYEMLKEELEELRKAGKQEEAERREKELKKPPKSTVSTSSLKQTIRSLTNQRDTLASEVEALKARLNSIGYVDAEAMKGVPVDDSLSNNIAQYLNKMGSSLSLTRVAPGRYRSLDGKEHIIRELRGNIMVRVGGGYVSMEHYLNSKFAHTIKRSKQDAQVKLAMSRKAKVTYGSDVNVVIPDTFEAKKDDDASSSAAASAGASPTKADN